MSGDEIVKVWGASPVLADDEVPGRTIVISGQVPTFDGLSRSDAHRFYDEQARLILGALNQSLPGGTLDSLFAQAAYDRASILRVVRQVPPPADDDVVDAGVIGFDDQLRTAIAHQWAAIRALENTSEGPGERIAAARALLRYDLDAEPTDRAALQAQRAAVLAIHRPTGSDKNECMGCGYDEGYLTKAWPCPTARAVGVTADA